MTCWGCDLEVEWSMTDHSMHHGTCLFLVENLVCCLIVIQLQMICIWLDSLGCHFLVWAWSPDHCCMSLTAERAKNGHNLLQCSHYVSTSPGPSGHVNRTLASCSRAIKLWRRTGPLWLTTRLVSGVDHYGSQRDWLVLSRLPPHCVSWASSPFTIRKQQKDIIIVLARRTWVKQASRRLDVVTRSIFQRRGPKNVSGSWLDNTTLCLINANYQNTQKPRDV